MNFKENARPLAMFVLVIALIIGGLLESVGYPMSEWLRYFAIGLVSEWFVERSVRKGRNE